LIDDDDNDDDGGGGGGGGGIDGVDGGMVITVVDSVLLVFQPGSTGIDLSPQQ